MLQLPAREIPVPTSVSAEAQAVLAMGPLAIAPAEPPALDDVAGMEGLRRERRRLHAVDDRRPVDFPVTVEARDTRPVSPCTSSRPTVWPTTTGACFLDIHGGAWVLGGGDLCVMTGSATADAPSGRGPGPSTTACRRTTRSRHRSTTASPPTARCSTERSPGGDHRRRHVGRRQPRRRARAAGRDSGSRCRRRSSSTPARST